MSGPVRPIGSATGPERVTPVQLPALSDAEREQRRREAEERRRRQGARRPVEPQPADAGDARPRVDVRA